MGSRRGSMLHCGLTIAAAAVCLMALPAPAQRLPANPPTAIANQSSMGPPIAATPTNANTVQHHRARVTYTDELLDVRADNSSLNQILREVSRYTGMKIIGGVADQRVFGNYGPAPAATVLQTLLDGTNTNMLLQENRVTHAPEQLILSPRTGGITPPGPSSASYDVTETEPEMPLPASAQPAYTQSPGQPQVGADASPGFTSQPGAANTTPAPSTPPSMPQPANNVLGNPNNVSPTVSTAPVTNSVPMSTLPTPSTAPPVSGIVDSPNPPPAGSTTEGFTSQTPRDNNPNTAPPATSPATTPPTATQTSPNGVKTPAEIYQELLQLQKQKANQKGNPQGSSAPQ